MMHRIAPAVLLGLCLSARATQITLIPSKDNTLFQSATGTLSGGIGSLFAGVTQIGVTHRSVMAFDLSAIPANAVVNTATLRMNVTNVGPGGASTFSLHPLLANWGEGTSDTGSLGRGAPSTPGAATWLHTFYNTGTWSTPGGDFAASPSASVMMSDFQAYTFTGAGMASAVQSWINAPATNFGWLMKNDEASAGVSFRFDSREALSASNRPMLTVDYTVPAGASSWIGDSDGSWSNSARWTAGVPDAAGAEAILGPVISASRTVALDSPRTVGTLTIDSAFAYQLTGANTLTLDASGVNVHLNVLQGEHDLQAPLAVASGKRLVKTGAGKVRINALSIPSIRLDAGTVALNTAGVETNAASLDFSGGTLDLGSVTLRVDNGIATQRTTLRSLLAAGSIVSSSLDVDTTLGYLEPTATRVDVKRLLKGDANGDGRVDTIDFNALAGNFGNADTFWMTGDFTYDGTVDSVDFTVLSSSYGKSAPSAPFAGGVVPEPTSPVFFLIASGLSLLLRRP